MSQKSLVSIIILLSALLIGCQRHDQHSQDSGQQTAEFSTNVTAYQVKGVLQEIGDGGAKARIAHEDIPGYMEAMTMQLDVRNTNELAGLQPGDKITFRMLVTDTDGWIDQIHKTGTRAPPPPARPPVSNQVAELLPGDHPPDYVFTNQLGQAFHLSDYKGQALAFTFIFTRCPFPTFCPRMNNNFGETQRRLQASNVGTNWQLLSISFDPEFDTPERLAMYAQTYHYDPAHWSFATSADQIIRQLGGAFGLSYWRDGALFNHNVRTVVINAAGRVQKIFPNNEWQPAELVAEMKTAMEAKP